MKKGLLFLLILMGLMPSIADAGGFLGMFDRTSTLDTVAIPFAFLDSLGSPVTGAAGDSILLIITSPSGTEVHRDSGLLATVTAYAWEDQPSSYAWTDKVSVLDGSSSSVGMFSYSLSAVDVSLDLTSFYTGTFQIIDQALSASLDSAGVAAIAAVLALAEVVNLNGMASLAATDIVSSGAITTSGGAVSNVTLTATTTDVTNQVTADMTKISGSALAADNLEEAFDDDATGPTMRLRGLVVVAAGTDSAAATFNGNGSAPGIDARGGTTGNGVTFTGGATSGHGAVLIAITSGDGLKVEGGGTGHGLNARSGGGATGNAIQATAASTNGDAIGLTATGTGVDLNAPDLVDLIWDEDTTGHGVNSTMGWLTSQTSASAMTEESIAREVWTIAGSDDSTYTAGTMGKEAEGWDGAGTGTNPAAVWGHIGTPALIEDHANNSSTQLQTNLSEATDDHYNGMSIVFMGDGDTETGQTRLITDYVGASGTIVFTPAVTGEAVTGDSIIIIPWAFTNVDSLKTSSITADVIAPSAISASEIANAAFTASKFGTGAFTSAVFASNAITAAAIKEDVFSEMADSNWSSTRDATLKSLVISNSAGDAVQFTSTGGNGDGFQVLGNGTGFGLLTTTGFSIRNSNGTAFIMGSDGGDGQGLQVFGNGTGLGMLITGGNRYAGTGLQVKAGDSGIAVHFAAPNDSGAVTFWVENTTTSGHAVQFVAVGGGSGLDIEGQPGINTRGYENTGAAGMHISGDAGSGGRGLVIQGFGPGDGLFITSDDSTGGGGGGGSGGAVELQVLQNQTGALHNFFDVDTANAFAVAAGIGKFIKDSTQGAGGSGSDTTAILAMMDNNWTSASGGSGWAEMLNDTLTASHGSGAWTSSAGGSGSETVTIKAVDTSGTDELLADVKVTILNAINTQIGTQFTNGSGSSSWSLDAEAHTLKGRRTGFIFPNHAITVSGTQTDTILGYNIVIPTPGNADLSTVFGYLKDNQDVNIVGATVTAVRAESGNAIDTTGTNVIVGAIAVYATSDSTGYFAFTLRRTITYSDTAKGFYNITAMDSDGRSLFNAKSIRVPNSGNLNLGDTLATRP